MLRPENNRNVLTEGISDSADYVSFSVVYYDTLKPFSHLLILKLFYLQSGELVSIGALGKSIY